MTKQSSQDFLLSWKIEAWLVSTRFLAFSPCRVQGKPVLLLSFGSIVSSLFYFVHTNTLKFGENSGCISIGSSKPVIYLAAFFLNTSSKEL